MFVVFKTSVFHSQQQLKWEKTTLGLLLHYDTYNKHYSVLYRNMQSN